VVAGAVGFDKAAVGGLTAAVLLHLALEFLERGTPNPVHLLPAGLGWRWGARPSMAGFRVRARPPGPWSGHAGEREGVGWALTAQSEQAGRQVLAAASGCSPGSVSSSVQGGHSQRTTSALGCCLVGPTWASTSALVAVGLPHNGQGRGADLAAVTAGHGLGSGSGRRWS
jgi:hypothetical protein